MAWMGLGLDGMVIIGHRYSESTFGANNCLKGKQCLGLLGFQNVL